MYKVGMVEKNSGFNYFLYYKILTIFSFFLKCKQLEGIFQKQKCKQIRITWEVLENFPNNVHRSHAH